MATFRKAPETIEAVRFDPWDTHRLKLPVGVGGCPGPCSDNWAYSGADFWVQINEVCRFPIVAGEWVMRKKDGFYTILEDRGDGRAPLGYEPVEEEAVEEEAAKPVVHQCLRMILGSVPGSYTRRVLPEGHECDHKWPQDSME
jgi:hypothetical protein